MQHLEVSGAVRHIYIYIYIYICVCVCVCVYVIRRLKVKIDARLKVLSVCLVGGLVGRVILSNVDTPLPICTAHITVSTIINYNLSCNRLQDNCQH